MCSSCGSYNQYCTHHHQQSNASMLWSNTTQYQNNPSYDDSDNYSFPSSPNSVDCTLSLGTPSTRFTTSDQVYENTPHRNSVSSFCWDLFHSTKQSSSASSKSNRHHSNATTSSGADSLLARRCANCDTTSTPLWRNGPRGPKSLCNACGIRYKKEERRAAAASTTAAHNAGMMMVDPHNGSTWSHQYTHQGTTPHQKMQMQCFGAPNNQEFRFMEDDRGAADGGVQFLSWLTYDRPAGLVHDFTR